MSNSEANGDDSLYFYKIVLDPQMEELEIPSEFLKHITEEAKTSAVVKGLCGNCWNVKIEEREDGMFFDDDWKNFAMEQHFEGGELLLFHYDGRKTFHVRIFDRIGVEK